MKNVTLMLAGMLAAVGASAAPVYVALSGDGSDGTSWVKAYTNIQTAINSPNAVNGVWIKADTYAITNPIIMANGVSLYGGFDGTEASLSERDWRANATIITNTVAADATSPVKRVVQCDSWSNWRLDGLRITGGSLYSASYSSDNSNRGAGVSMNGSAGSNVIANCSIAGNRGLGGSGAYSAGLGMNLAVNATFLIENTIFDENVSQSINGHAQLANGNNTTVTFRNCVFRRGQSGGYGSGVTKGKDCQATLRIENCVFISNGKVGGGDRTQALEITGPGGGPTYVYNCSFLDHTNSAAPAVAENENDSTLVMYNNHFYNNTTMFKDWVSSSLSNNVNTIADLNALPEAEGNVAGDPRFIDRAKLDLRFPVSSPCVDAGTNFLGFAPDSDYYGNARPSNIAGAGGETAGNTHDIGIYELLPGVNYAVFVALSGDGSDGSSWAKAYTNIQTAVGHPYASVDGVWIKSGVYPITSPVMMTNNAALYGGFAGTETLLTQRDWRANATIITNTVTASASEPIKRVVQCDSQSNWRLDGLHMVGGSLYSSSFSGNNPNRGAGVSMNGSGGSNVIANCRIAGNRGAGGAGAYSAGLGLNVADKATYVIENTILDDNVGQSVNGHAHLTGGNPATTVMFRNCVFRRGKCGNGNYGSGITKGVSCWSTLRIENCVFIDNGHSLDRTKAIEINPGGGPTYVYNCSFVDHTNSAAPVVAELTDDSTMLLYNNHFYNNSLIYRDVAPGATNNINSITALNDLSEAEGNLAGDPKYIDRANLDLRFPKSSPCVDAGTNVLGSAPSSDYYGNVRPVDIVGVGAEGAGNGYDIGIYEVPLPPPPPGTLFKLL